MQIPKLKVKVYFYHLFMLAIVMLLCFYLVYRDMKRVESNVLGIYKRVGVLEKFNNTFTPKMNELLDRSRDLSNTQISTQLPITKENIDNILDNDDEIEKYINVDNMMKNIVNIQNNVLDDDNTENLVHSENNLDDDVVDFKNQNNEEEVIESNEEDVIESNEEEVIKNNDVDGVMDLLYSIENKDNTVELCDLNEEQLL